MPPRSYSLSFPGPKSCVCERRGAGCSVSEQAPHRCARFRKRGNKGAKGVVREQGERGRLVM
eukprot:2119938-Rhodomonas_salina.2